MTTVEKLGPAERIIQTLITYQDHMVHNRPGIVVPDRNSNIGVRWMPGFIKTKPEGRIFYRQDKVGNKTRLTQMGMVDNDNKVRTGGQVVGEYRTAGIFPEVVVWMYSQVAEVWKLDNEFAARWASYAWGQDHKDLKVILAAFMLVQSRAGRPITENGHRIFDDEDYRAVGEAMMLLTRNDNKHFDAKLITRIRQVLAVPAVVQLNHDLGFNNSVRRPALGRYDGALRLWLKYREENPKMLEGLVRAGYRTTVMTLTEWARYKPQSSKFFEILRWKQVQAKDGHRQLAIGQEMAAAEVWEGLTERQICEKIVADKPNLKRIIGLLPKGQGLTRAIVAAAIEAGSLSDKDLLIYTPTLEELGLLQVPDIQKRWEEATKKAEDTRAANIALRVKSQETKDKLQAAADTAVQKAVEAVVRGLRIYVMVDISGSMQQSIEAAKEYVAKFLQGFPSEQIHVSVFNTTGREVQIRHRSAAGVANAFANFRAGGGTNYAAGVAALQHHKPKADEDAIFIFIGDEEATEFHREVEASGLKPLAFGFVKTFPNSGAPLWRMQQYGADNNVAVRHTATNLGIPCFMIDEKTFDDVYAIPRTIRALVAATPVGKKAVGGAFGQPRFTLVEQILKTDLLKKPVWAS